MSRTATPARPAGVSPRALVAISALSAAIALSAAWLYLASRSEPDEARPTISPEQMVGGRANSAVKVSGSAEIGKPAPEVSFTYLDGGRGSLASFAGTTTLVNFWSSTCAPCLAEMPALERVANDSAGSLNVIGVDVTDSVEAGSRMVKRTGVTYPIARDPKGEILAAFGGTQLPHTVLIGPDGVVRAIRDGALDEAEFRELVSS